MKLSKNQFKKLINKILLEQNGQNGQNYPTEFLLLYTEQLKGLLTSKFGNYYKFEGDNTIEIQGDASIGKEYLKSIFDDLAQIDTLVQTLDGSETSDSPAVDRLEVFLTKIKDAIDKIDNNTTVILPRSNEDAIKEDIKAYLNDIKEELVSIKFDIEDDFEFAPGESSVENPERGTQRVAAISYNSNTEGIQKIVDPYEKHTKHDGAWGKGTQKAWEMYIDGKETIIGKSKEKDEDGNPKNRMFNPNFDSKFKQTFPNVSQEDMERIKSTLKKNTKVLTELGYGVGAKHVLQFLKDINMPSVVKDGNKSSGKTSNPAIKMPEMPEEIDEKFIEDIDASMFADEVNSKKDKNKFLQNAVEKAASLRSKLKEKGEERRIKNLDSKIKNMFKKNKNALDAYEAQVEQESLQEGLSRASLYRRRYYGRY